MGQSPWTFRLSPDCFMESSVDNFLENTLTKKQLTKENEVLVSLQQRRHQHQIVDFQKDKKLYL